jgi:hypothetical protein
VGKADLQFFESDRCPEICTPDAAGSGARDTPTETIENARIRGVSHRGHLTQWEPRIECASGSRKRTSYPKLTATPVALDTTTLMKKLLAIERAVGVQKRREDPGTGERSAECLRAFGRRVGSRSPKQVETWRSNSIESSRAQRLTHRFPTGTPPAIKRSLPIEQDLAI